ncbi:two component system sensor kinase [Vibrio neptunius]|uniref:histidine kinase n=1 Tax=Vibrio neptunius TaxID=170651 RepID=A0ABS2ZWJ5_9VIBR|nr:two component system sensor kinase [Vibrio neptunius]MBN3491984.1 two component system sensor kinase [Vibrio neptunius]MBN3514321.1 two component system sensor kinase [Vibrio neptunius]MBN3548564.1 two component system sensor kinase [Vibrio neptunius]MBN3576610.1 two component system sensor kinase [Vibrio neptunius]MCH9870274.1 two component system sensor kinase [Vibrio neptunius]
MKTRWNSSLVTKLTIAFISVFMGLWVLIQINAFDNTYNSTLNQTLKSYNQISEIRAQMNRSLFAQAMDDTQQFEQRLQRFQTMKVDPNVELVAHQFNIGNTSPHIERKQLWALQTFGIAGQQRYVDSFIIEPGRQVSIYAASEVERSHLDQRLDEIVELSQLPTEDGFRWSEPKYDAARDSTYLLLSYTLNPEDERARQVGFAIDIKDVVTVSNVYSKGDQNLFLTPKGVIPFHGQDKPNSQTQAQLNSHIIHSGGIENIEELFEVADYYVVSKFIDGPDWLQISMVPKLRIERIAYTPFYSELKWSLISFAVMILVMLWILWKSLAETIRNFVGIIKSDRQPTFARRLPESRKDELGDIARAYNMLLDTIKSSYDELESKVEQRTVELAHAKQLAEKATARKSEHLTNISHELRTPLNGITGSLELLRNTQMNEQQADLRNTAYTCAKSLLSIINNLLDFSRIEADQIELNLANNPLLKVVDEAMLTIQSNVVNKPIELKTLVADNVPESCTFDPIRVRQVLVNLLGNAAKFTEQGHIFLYIEVKDDTLCFTVEDTGPGIAAHKLDEVFEPFRQSSSHQVGTGLGLPISRKLATIMGGNLTLKSELGTGSTFIFSLPMTEPGMRLRLKQGVIDAPENLHTQISLWGGECVDNHSDSLQNEELNYLPWRLWKRLYEIQHGISTEKTLVPAKEMLPWKLKILLVDDVETNRDIITKMLTELGQEVICVESGEFALQSGERHIFDLVLMDIRMPGLDGYQATQLWRDSESILDTECPIMALTANANHSEHDKSMHLMNGYLTKPVSLKELAKALDIAAEIQIDRDMQPDINIDSNAPIMDFTEEEFTQRLANHFQDMAQAAKESFADHNWQELRDILHNVKGSAGLAGVNLVSEAAAELEKQLELTNHINAKELEPLLRALKNYQTQS